MFGWKKKYFDLYASHDNLENALWKEKFEHEATRKSLDSVRETAQKYRVEAERLYHTPGVHREATAVYPRCSGTPAPPPRSGCRWNNVSTAWCARCPVVSTEVKADTEAAFSRGEENQRRKIVVGVGQLQQQIRESQKQAKAAIDEAFGPAWEKVTAMSDAMRT